MKNLAIWFGVLLTIVGTAWGQNHPKAAAGAPAGGKTKTPAKELEMDLGKGIKLEMVLIPAGEFLMGSPDSDKDAQPSEKPRHRVRITKPFYLGKYPVTQEQWEAVMGNNPSHFQGPKNPVEEVGWDDCQRFLDRLQKRKGNPRGTIRLPTEAQWEYACRAGSTTRYSFGDAEAPLGEYAWYRANSGGKTHPVARKSRTPGDCSTCTGTSGSGAPIGMMPLTMPIRPPTIRRGRQPSRRRQPARSRRPAIRGSPPRRNRQRRHLRAARRA